MAPRCNRPVRRTAGENTGCRDRARGQDQSISNVANIRAGPFVTELGIATPKVTNYLVS